MLEDEELVNVEPVQQQDNNQAVVRSSDGLAAVLTTVQLAGLATPTLPTAVQSVDRQGCCRGRYRG